MANSKAIRLIDDLVACIHQEYINFYFLIFNFYFSKADYWFSFLKMSSPSRTMRCSSSLLESTYSATAKSSGATS